VSTPVQPSSRGRGLRPLRSVLSNGAVITVKATSKTPAVAVNLALRAGSVCDPPDSPGAMHLLAQLIDRGTSQRSAGQIAEELDARGVSLSVLVNRHLLTVLCACLAEDIDFVLTLLGEIVRAPSIPESELAIRRGEVITSLRQDEDNPAVRALDHLMECLYGPAHPYGRRVKGTIRAVERLTRQDLADLQRRHVAPSGLSVIVVGDVDVDRLNAQAIEAFGGWSAAPVAPVVIEGQLPGLVRRRTVIPMMNKAQADIAYGFRTIVRSDAAYFPFWLLNNVLGQYAMGGRLGDSIRERQGMAYYVSSTFDPNVIEGPLVVRAGVSASNVDRAVASIDAEMAAIVGQGITAKELAESRQYMIGSMPRQLETNAGIAQFLQTAEFFGLGPDYDLRLPDCLLAVTREQVHEVAQRYLNPEWASVVIAGPYNETLNRGESG
jgi:zinc protease